MIRPVRRALGSTAATLALALVAGGCSDSDGSGQTGAPTTPSASATEHVVETQVSYGRVTGHLTPTVRKRLAHQVGDVVDGWARAAYLGGDYPRHRFSESWPGFTSGAKERARGDKTLMSNEDIGARIDGVTARRSRVRLDVLAVKKHPVGVTAHVLLAFRTTGKVQRDVRVMGRLFLTHTDRGWKVFGYDMTKGAV